jgi:integrase
MARNGIPYVTERYGVYQYVRRVPVSVKRNKALYAKHFNNTDPFRRSLSTKSKTMAFQAASTVNHWFDEIVELAETKGVSKVSPAQTQKERAPTYSDLQKIAKDQKDAILNDWAEDIRRSQVDVEAREFLHGKLENELAHRAKEESKRANSFAPTDREIEMARAVNSSSGFEVDERSSDFADIILAVKDGTNEGFRQVDELLNGAALPSKTRSTVIGSLEDNMLSPGADILLSEVIRLQEQNEDFSPKTLIKRRRSQAEFFSLIGDLQVSRIEREHVRVFLDQMGQRTSGHDERPVSKGTVAADLSAISSPIQYAISREWISGPNPASNFQIEAFVRKRLSGIAPPKRRFYDDELETIFNHPIFRGCKSSGQPNRNGTHLIDDSRFWAPVVALYTGSRAAELGGLKVSEVSLTSVPHIVMQPNEFRRIKNNELREIPILDALMDLGFGEYIDRVSKSGSIRVFPDWTANKSGEGDEQFFQWSNGNIVRGFHRNILQKLLPKDPAHSRAPVSFHSFRGSFKKLLYESGDMMLANQVIGHSIGELDQRYIGSVDIAELHSKFRSLNFADLRIQPRK